MTSCAIKICRNYVGRLKATSKITYHRIPNDPILKNQWIEIIRKSRGEDFWRPSKTTVICSDHFNAKSLYFTNNQKRRRLQQDAVPCKALFLSSVCDESANDEENSQELPASPATNEESETSCEVQSTTSSAIKHINVVQANPDTSASTSRITKVIEIDDDSDIIEDFPDLEYVFDTPEAAKLRKDLYSKTVIQKKHNLKIQSLTRKNLRLKKKVAAFKQIIERMKNEKTQGGLCSACRGPIAK